MKRILLLLYFLSTSFGFSQNANEDRLRDSIKDILEDKIEKRSSLIISNDSIIYKKNIAISDEKKFEDNLKNKYSGKDFEYIDNLKNPEPKRDVKPVSNSNFGANFFIFLASVFPYVLGIIVVLIILKSLINTESGFWSFKKSDTKITKAEIYQQEEENINENDYDKLLKAAIFSEDYRLATRYYYLSVLKKLSENKQIEYHKEKTNTDYLFELKNKKTRKDFSQLSYIYDYVWYGEFALDTSLFTRLENKFQSFIKKIK